MLVNVHRRHTPNRGDLASAPLSYLTSRHTVKHLDLMRCDGSVASATEQLERAELIVVGGGGLLDHEKFASSLGHLIQHYREKLVIWGAGGNSLASSGFRTDLSRVPLVGRRDYPPPDDGSWDWVPCASCLSPELHELIERRRSLHVGGIGILENNAGAQLARVGDCHRSDVRRMGNKNVSLTDMLKFILSVDLIVTSSFHGIFWATLCQVPAIGIPTTSKFHTLRHQQVLAKADDWVQRIGETQTFPNALKECVDANLAFMAKVNERYPGVDLEWQFGTRSRVETLKRSAVRLKDSYLPADGRETTLRSRSRKLLSSARWFGEEVGQYLHGFLPSVGRSKTRNTPRVWVVCTEGSFWDRALGKHVAASLRRSGASVQLFKKPLRFISTAQMEPAPSAVLHIGLITESFVVGSAAHILVLGRARPNPADFAKDRGSIHHIICSESADPEALQSFFPKASIIPAPFPSLVTRDDSPSSGAGVLLLLVPLSMRATSTSKVVAWLSSLVQNLDADQVRVHVVVDGPVAASLAKLRRLPQIEGLHRVGNIRTFQSAFRKANLILFSEFSSGLEPRDAVRAGVTPLFLAAPSVPTPYLCTPVQHSDLTTARLLELRGVVPTTGLTDQLDEAEVDQKLYSILESVEQQATLPIAQGYRKGGPSHRLIDVYLTTSRRPQHLGPTLKALVAAVDSAPFEFRLNVFVDQLDAQTLELIEPHLSRINLVTTSTQMGLPFLYNMLLTHQAAMDERSERFADYVCYIQDDCLIQVPDRYFELMVAAYEEILPERQTGYVTGFHCAVHPGFDTRTFRDCTVVLSDSIDGKNFMAPPSVLRSVGPLTWYFPDGQRRGNPGPARGSHFDLWQWKESPNSLMRQQRVNIVIPDLCAHSAQSKDTSTWGNETTESSLLRRAQEGRIYQTRSQLAPWVTNEFKH